jgi:hypothetical protein
MRRETPAELSCSVDVMAIDVAQLTAVDVPAVERRAAIHGARERQVATTCSSSVRVWVERVIGGLPRFVLLLP